PCVFALITLALFTSLVPAATITWTNTDGGFWSDAVNWSPNQVPTAGDSAVITAPGTYAVNSPGSVEVGSFTLGGARGEQTLSLAVILSNVTACVVNANGILSVTGGTVQGPGLVTVNGQLVWSGGQFGRQSAVALSAGGVLMFTGAGVLDFGGVLT